MGSVEFDGEDEYRTRPSNDEKYKPPRMLLDGCGAVNHVWVPKKLRSAMKKQPRESVTQPLTISRKQYHTSQGVATVGKDGPKKSKLSMGHITRDEEEVAETLNALADMFPDANKATHPGLNNEPPETKSSAALEAEDTGNQTLQEESKMITSNFTFNAVNHSSNSIAPTCQVFDDTQRPELLSSNQSATPCASGNQCEHLVHRSRISTIDMVSKQPISPDQVAVPRMQYGKHYYNTDDRSNGFSLSPRFSARGDLMSESQGSCLRLPIWFENTNSAAQPCVIDESTTVEKHSRARKSWKRCSAHVYISRLIKVLQISESKEDSLGKPTQLTASGGAELQIYAGMHSQMVGQTGRNGYVSLSGITQSAADKYSTDVQNDIVLHKRSLQHEQLSSESSALCTSTNQCDDFLSLSSGRGHCPKAPKQFHEPNVQLQNNAAIPFSLLQSGYSSTFLGHYSALAARQVESQQQKYTVNLTTQYNTTVASRRVPDRINGGGDCPSLQNYAHTIFPHLHAATGARHQQFSSSQQQFMSVNSLPSVPLSSMKIRGQLPMQYEKNEAALFFENTQHLQLPCKEHLRD